LKTPREESLRDINRKRAQWRRKRAKRPGKPLRAASRSSLPPIETFGFRDAEPGGVASGQDGAMFGEFDIVEKLHDRQD
jgi:hypothetical protein